MHCATGISRSFASRNERTVSDQSFLVLDCLARNVVVVHINEPVLLEPYRTGTNVQLK